MYASKNNFVPVLFSLPFEVPCSETFLGCFLDLASQDLFVARGSSCHVMNVSSN